MNYNFEKTGTIYIKAIRPTTINGISYAANEIIAAFNDVDFLFNTREISSPVDAGLLLTTSSTEFLDSIIVENISQQKALMNLIFSIQDDIIYLESKICKEKSEEGIIILKETSDSKISNVFVYNRKGEKIPIVSATGNIIRIAGIDDTYKISYTIEKKSSEFVSLPSINEYIKLEIKILGNIGNESGYLYLIIEKAKLNNQPNFFNGDFFSGVLNFSVIDAKNNKVKTYFTK